MPLRVIDLFAGIGGFTLAGERIVGGFQTIAFVERNQHCQKVLARHWPDVPIFDDICTYEPAPHSADVVCGGFPCQDISSAGLRAGIKEGTRSGLFFELMRVVRVVQPRYVVLENVSAIVADGLGTVLGELAQAGFDAEWACIPASDLGACHRRNRWWCVARHAARCSGEKQQDRHALQFEASERTEVSELGRADGVGATDASTPRRDPQPHARSSLASPRFGWDFEPPRLNPDWKGYVSEPVLCGGNDGLSNRPQRLQALGNSVVPQVAAIPLARVKQFHNQTS